MYFVDDEIQSQEYGLPETWQEKCWTSLGVCMPNQILRPGTAHNLACIASVSALVRRESMGREQQKNFRAKTWLQTLAMQATHKSKTHLQFCKRFLEVNNKASNVACRAELGRLPLNITINKKSSTTPFFIIFSLKLKNPSLSNLF